MIFDDILRTDTSRKRETEDSFEFLNRSACHEFDRVRQFLNECASNYPSEHREELLTRIRGRNERNFQSASFELILHEILRRMDCEITVHPPLEKGRVDFLVTTPDNKGFYLEAVNASDIAGELEGAHRIREFIKERLNENPHHNFFVEFSDDGIPITQPSANRLVRELHSWLDTLNPDEVLVSYEKEGFDSLPNFEWLHEEWTLSFRPYPLKPERRGQATALIGLEINGAKWSSAQKVIRKAIIKKGNSYGKLDAPFIIALNYTSLGLNADNIMGALYGQEVVVFDRQNPENARSDRNPDGAWNSEYGPRYTRISGLWAFDNLQPSNIISRNPTIWPNIWAEFEMPNILVSVPHYVFCNERLNLVEGLSLQEILALPENWPE